MKIMYVYAGIFIMTLLYLVPSTEPIPDPDTCAPCGSFVRRSEPWSLAGTESSGGESKLRILQSDKNAFTDTDNHVMYLKQSAGSILTIKTRTDEPYIYAWADGSMTAKTTMTQLSRRNDPGSIIDLIMNPLDYKIVMNGVELDQSWFDGNNRESHWWKDRTTTADEYFTVTWDGDNAGKQYFQFWAAAGSLTFTGNLKIYKDNVLVSDTDFYYETTDYNTAFVRCSAYTMTLNLGNYFGDVDDSYGIVTVIDNR